MLSVQALEHELFLARMAAEEREAKAEKAELELAALKQREKLRSASLARAAQQEHMLTDRMGKLLARHYELVREMEKAGVGDADAELGAQASATQWRRAHQPTHNRPAPRSPRSPRPTARTAS